MKKLIISLIASFLLCAFAYGQPNRPDPVEEHRKVERWLEGHKAEAAKAERDLDVKIAELRKNGPSPGERGFDEVEKQTEILIDKHNAFLTAHAGERKNLEGRLAELKEIPEVVKWGKPEVLTDKEKLDPRKSEGEVLKQVKEGKLSQEDARKKLDSLRGEMEKRGEFKRPKRPAKEELKPEIKAKLDAIKDLQDALAKKMKTKLDGLKKDGATREEMREAVHAFQKDNKVILEDIRERHAGIQQSLKDARPPKPERPELTAEIKVKVEALKEKQKEMHTARKDLHENLKDKSKEDREALIADFKEANKAKHEEIKTKAKEVKEEIRALVETEATRTSDL